MKTVNVERRDRRKKRISSNLVGTEKKPRVVVFRSNRYIYAQAIDDIERKTLASSSGQKVAGKKSEQAKKVGVDLAVKLKKKKINEAIFDRSFYSYLGRVKALCEGLREGGIKV